MTMSDLDAYSSLFDLTGKTIVVVGSGSGIGEAGAFALAAHGADVVCGDLSADAAEQTAATIVSGGGSARPAVVDTGDAQSLHDLYSSVDRLDGLVHTPAINVRKRLLEVSEEEFMKVVSLNLLGTFHAITAAGRLMSDQGSGSIVAISSIRSQVVEPGQGVYAATKAGVLQLIKTLAAELGPDNVRVNAIAPGVVETPLTTQIRADQEWYDAYASRSALGRWSTPSELAGPIVYLSSDAASFVTGSLLVVDGGWLAIDGRFDPPL
jgi:NAD(P)-dependent dehydrogenase (short-subunit alcohol dehydrogenase family)